MSKGATEGGATKPQPLGDVLPANPIGYQPESRGAMVPYDYVGPLIEAKVGQMKAEIDRDFQAKLGKIDDLPTKWQLAAGALSAILVTMGLLFAILSYFGDRQDTTVDRAATLTKALTRIEEKLDRTPAPGPVPTRESKSDDK